MNPQLRIKWEKVGIITILYIVIGTLMPLMNRILLHSNYSLGPSEEYVFSLDVFTGMFAGLSGGFLGGLVLVFIINEKARRKPFGYGILLTAIFFVLIYYFTSFSVAFILEVKKSGLSPFHPEVIQSVLLWVTAPTAMVAFVHWGLVVICTQFMLQVNDKFGQGILRNFLIGKYHKPSRERRIFMFLDIKSSTTIAEKIGHNKYFKLLRDFYSDITSAIISTKGEVYQYVGDEIVVSWKMKNGLKHSNCIECFYQIKNEIENLSERYSSLYGLVPKFKAGYHLGEVTAGEIGIMKRDIIYSGDVLNTCARIQEQCNHYNVDILVSEELINSVENRWVKRAKKLGDITLRGKDEKVGIYTLL
ncbi:MAG: adenylate/guanylate cyclase domain-containing protein [Cyclobacteriaceae bacterium]